jgi:hypothetical protein
MVSACPLGEYVLIAGLGGSLGRRSVDVAPAASATLT